MNWTNRIAKIAGTAPTGLAVATAMLLGYLLHAGLATDGRAHGGSAAQAPPAAGSGSPAVETWWTCSMHPQVRRDQAARCPLCGMDLVEVVSASRGGLRELSPGPEALALLDVRTTPVERRVVEAQVRMVGKLDHDETRLADLTAWVPGRLDRLYVDYTGIPVTRGDHMVQLFSRTLYAAQEELLLAIRGSALLDDAVAPGLRGSGTATAAAARERLRQFGLTPAQVAAVEERGTPSDHLTILAPIGGVVIHKHLQQGAWVQEGTRIYTIADLTHLWLRLEAYESDLPWLHYGQEVEFDVQAHPGERFHGTISFIDPVLDARTRTVNVRVNVDNVDLRLKPEMFAHAVVRAPLAAGGRLIAPELVDKWICPMHPEVIEDVSGACSVCGMDLRLPADLGLSAASPDTEPPLVVPATAVLRTGKRAVVYVAREGDDGPFFEGREIVLGPRAGDHYLVRHGLQEGERVVTRGNFKLDSALQIEASPSMMTPFGAGAPGGRPGPGTGATPLPDAARLGIDEVERAHAAVGRALSDGGLEEALAAFERLAADVAALDAETLEGRAGAVWQEVAMRLSNDAVIARVAGDLAGAQEAHESAERTLAFLRAELGTTPPRTARIMPPDLPVEFREGVAGIFAAYLDGHAALAGDDDAGAARAAERARAALAQAASSIPSGASGAAFEALAQGAGAALDALTAAGDLAARRAAFEGFSAAVGDLVESFGTGADEPVLRVHCPMAFGRGADWLQLGAQVRNPYYGSAMLTCGAVVGRLSLPVEAGHDH